MGTLTFIAGVFFGGVAVFLRPWFTDLCFSHGYSRSTEELLSFRPWPEDEASQMSKGTFFFAPAASPRALSARVLANDQDEHRSRAEKDEHAGHGSGAEKDTHAGHEHKSRSEKHTDNAENRPQADTGSGMQGHQQGTAPEHGSHHSQKEVAELQLERGISVMTLGAVAFQMCLFYLVNHHDVDMQRYAYQIIGETISIFCAVLMFNACYACVEELTLAWSQAYHIVIFVALVLFFYVAMEVVVMMFARVRGTKALRVAKIHGKELNILYYVVNAKTYGAGAAQMCGAATIRSFGRLQLWAFVEVQSFSLLACVVPMALLFFIVMMGLMHCIRIIIIKWDGIVDEAEYTWCQVAELCEHEVCGLCIGFLLATVARVAVTESFPHVILSEIKHPHDFTDATLNQILSLIWIGLLCGCVCFCLVWACYGMWDQSVDHETLRRNLSSRLLLISVKITGMTFAWCICFANHLLGMEAAFINGASLRLMLSLIQSVASFAVIRVLDKFSDMECTGHAFNKAIVSVIECLAVSLGLSWEHAFHECVHVTVEYVIEDPHFNADDPKVVSFFLCSALCAMVFPAYRWYIVPHRYELLEAYERETESKEADFMAKTMTDSSPLQRSLGPMFSDGKSLGDGLEERTYEFESISRTPGDDN